MSGLRTLLDRQQATRAGFDEVTITVEEGGMKRELTFRGRCIARDEKYTHGGKVHEEERLYATGGGRFAHYARSEANWNYWSDGRNWDDATSLEGYPERRAFTVVDTLDDLDGVASASVLRAAGENQSKPAREYLDI